MQTLYELLGALPDDDAESLRAAFRRAVKAHHPDNHPDDPDAPQRFRRIVRARDILGDDQQRAVYDSLLAEAHQEQVLNSGRGSFSEARYRVPGAISTVVIASLSIAAFLLLESALTNAIVPLQVQDIVARASALTVAMAARPSETVGQVGEHNKSEKASLPSDREVRDPLKETAAPVAVASADDSGAMPAIPEAATKDARYYRERGGLAYRSGDLSLALVDFDLAIKLDPDFADAYIDRAIVLRRLGDMKRAMADVAQAKRIDDLKPRQPTTARRDESDGLHGPAASHPATSR